MELENNIRERIETFILPGFRSTYIEHISYLSDIKGYPIKFPSDEMINSFIAEIYAAILNREDYNYRTIIAEHSMTLIDPDNPIEDVKTFKESILQIMDIQIPYMKDVLQYILYEFDTYIAKHNVKMLERLFKEHIKKDGHEFD